MKHMQLAFVPPGGGDATHTMPAELPAVPRAGDRLSILRVAEAGHEHFVVRRAWWLLDPAAGQAEAVPYTEETFASGNPFGGRPATVRRIYVECEPAEGPWPTAAHRAECEKYRRRGLPVKGCDAAV